MTARMTAAAVPAPGRRRDETPAEHLRVVRGREITPAVAQRRARLIVGTAVAMAAMAFFGVVAAHVAITQRQFQLEQLQRQGSELQADYDRLRLEVAELESPARIVAAAQELGLEQPDEVTYLTPEASSFGQPIADDGAIEGRTTTSWQLVKPHLADR